MANYINLLDSSNNKQEVNLDAIEEIYNRANPNLENSSSCFRYIGTVSNNKFYKELEYWSPFEDNSVKIYNFSFESEYTKDFEYDSNNDQLIAICRKASLMIGDEDEYGTFTPSGLGIISFSEMPSGPYINVSLTRKTLGVELDRTRVRFKSYNGRSSVDLKNAGAVYGEISFDIYIMPKNAIYASSDAYSKDTTAYVRTDNTLYDLSNYKLFYNYAPIKIIESKHTADDSLSLYKNTASGSIITSITSTIDFKSFADIQTNDISRFIFIPSLIGFSTVRNDGAGGYRNSSLGMLEIKFSNASSLFEIEFISRYEIHIKSNIINYNYNSLPNSTNSGAFFLNGIILAY